jgi:hypothetical protein
MTHFLCSSSQKHALLWWLLFFSPLSPTGHYMYRQYNHSAILRSAETDCVYLVCVDLRSKNSDYFPIQHWLVFITERECVYCAVRTGSLNILQISLCFKFWFFKVWHAYRHEYAKQLYQQVSIKYLEMKEQKIFKMVTHEQRLILRTAGLLATLCNLW